LSKFSISEIAFSKFIGIAFSIGIHSIKSLIESISKTAQLPNLSANNLANVDFPELIDPFIKTIMPNYTMSRQMQRG